MKYKEWKRWLSLLPWYFKLFVLIILFRPLIDSFYQAKESIGILSPLYITGAIVFFLSIYIILSKTAIRGSIDKYFKVFTIFFIISTLISITMLSDVVEIMQYILKMMLPVYLFFFLRRFIKSREMLEGVLQTFLYSMIFVCAVFLYEIFVNPIRVEYRTTDVTRIQGFFGDVASYGLYLNLTLIVLWYRYLKNPILTRTFPWLLLFTVIIGGLAQVKINHIASLVVYVMINSYGLLYVIKRNFVIVFLLLLPLMIFIMVSSEEIIPQDVETLVAPELDAFDEGEDITKLGHGRVGRLAIILSDWEEQSIIVKLFGMPFGMSSFGESWKFNGSHNDFVRMFIYTGIAGFLFYILFLISIYIKAGRTPDDITFLCRGTLLFLGLYSLTLTPTLYPNAMYLIMTIFAFIVLPLQLIKPQNHNA